MKDLQFLQQKYIVNTYPNRGISLIRGNGVYLYDINGTGYLDMMSNYGVNIFGYNHPTITKAIASQIKKLTNLHGSFNNDMRSFAAQKLMESCGGNMTQVYFSNSGAEAIEATLKFVALSTGKRKIIACKHSYHGKTLGALSLTYGEKYRQPFAPYSWDTVFIDYNNPQELENAIDDSTAAFIVEPIQGEGGILVPDNGYLKQIRDICDDKNILLVFDEIQSGCGRTGKFLASQWENVAPDILCLGKGIAGCLPVGITVVNQKVASKITRNIHTSTFGGNPLTCSGIFTVLELLDQKLLEHITVTGTYFMQQLKTIESPFTGETRGKGLMIGIEILNDKRNEILKKIQQELVLAIPAGENVVRFLPPYIIEKKHVDLVIDKLKKILNNVLF